MAAREVFDFNAHFSNLSSDEQLRFSRGLWNIVVNVIDTAVSVPRPSLVRRSSSRQFVRHGLGKQVRVATEDDISAAQSPLGELTRSATSASSFNEDLFPFTPQLPHAIHAADAYTPPPQPSLPPPCAELSKATAHCTSNNASIPRQESPTPTNRTSRNAPRLKACPLDESSGSQPLSNANTSIPPLNANNIIADRSRPRPNSGKPSSPSKCSQGHPRSENCARCVFSDAAQRAECESASGSAHEEANSQSCLNSTRGLLLHTAEVTELLISPPQELHGRLERYESFDSIRDHQVVITTHCEQAQDNDGYGTINDYSKIELAIMKKIAHPRIVRLFEIIDDPSKNKLYLVLDYIDGGVVCEMSEDGKAESKPPQK
eukprot:gene20611-31748_t